ncbi:MAG: hypothetical protein U1E70_25930 [Acetobacteraceae bacterium]
MALPVSGVVGSIVHHVLQASVEARGRSRWGSGNGRRPGEGGSLWRLHRFGRRGIGFGGGRGFLLCVTGAPESVQLALCGGFVPPQRVGGFRELQDGA